MAEGFRQDRPPPPPLPARPGFPPPLGRPPPPPPLVNPPPPPLTNPPPRPPPPPRFQTSSFPPPPSHDGATSTTAAHSSEASSQRTTNQSESKKIDSLHDVSTTGSHEAMAKKEEGERHKSDPVGSKVKMSFGGGSGVLGKRPAGAITMKLKPQMDTGTKTKKAKTELPTVKKTLVAQAFGSDSEEEEEMPPEAKLKMRNIGKDTPTSAGPNSFNKSMKGFSDPRGSWRNEIDD